MSNTTYMNPIVANQTLQDLVEVTSCLRIIIDPKTMSILKILTFYVFQMPILFLGVITNSLVIITYIRCGLTDCITVSFLALAISDFGYSTLFFVLRFSSMYHGIVSHPVYSVRMDPLAYVLSFHAMCFNDVSVLITVFTAIQKCCCVAIPHLFKNIFTPRKATFIVMTMSVCVLCLYIPLYQSFRLEPIFFTSVNQTVVYLRVLPIFYQMIPIWQSFSRVILPMSAQSIVIVTLCIMSYKLRQSSKFRTSLAHQHESSNSEKLAETDQLGHKEARALAAVTVVSSLFIAATLPQTIMYFFHSIFPILKEPRYKNVQGLVFNSQNILIHANATVNIFVYLKYNTKFKETFNGLWICRKREV